MDLEGLDPVALGAALSVLPPTHPLVAAARAAVDLADMRDDQRRALWEASKDVAAACAQTGATQAGNTLQMWKARAETDGPESRAAEKAAELASPLLPEPREPAGAELSAATAAAVAMARQWIADREADEADLERRALEARWVAADRAAEAAALEAVHDLSA